jgi:RWD domain
MTDHAEEQEMEAEAMVAIFDAHFEILEASRWRVTIYPETGTSDEQELESINHVGCRLLVSLPDKYPEVLPELDIEIIKGLAADHQDEILRIADEEAEANIGAPSIFAVTERIREWLVENNIKGLDDVSMHAQMMRKKVLEEKAKVRSISWLVSACVVVRTLPPGYYYTLHIQQTESIPYRIEYC